MKTRLFTIFLFIFSFSLVFAGGSKEADNSRNNEVVIYAYDSFCSEWGSHFVCTQPWDLLYPMGC